ncbi:MAG TPA: 4Fe-4S binding protein [Candidatus Paraprevotella stercorigallinarum]|jgi:2-oxoglutarate ferredoxin oxidoreductase subunit delta|nr:4Fe-4S binding protein [Candidatus Paraprevotella stercorigallinarum]
MKKIIGAVVIDKERCKGCNLCVIACPLHLLSLAEKNVNKKGYHYAERNNNEATCIGCASCGIVCPDGCITVYKKKVD